MSCGSRENPAAGDLASGPITRDGSTQSKEIIDLVSGDVERLSCSGSSSVQAQNRQQEELEVPENVLDFDTKTAGDPYQVAIYATDIYAYLKKREKRFLVKKYLQNQPELNKRIRCMLVDWMVEVQEGFNMTHETLYLGVKLLDLFLGRHLVKRAQVQLVGATALYIAAKYEKIHPPGIREFIRASCYSFTISEFKRMEQNILTALNYEIGIPISYSFLRRYARCAMLDTKVLNFAKYVLEMSLMDYELIDTLDSLMAAASLLLALKILNADAVWTPALQYYSTYTIHDISSIARRIFQFLEQPPRDQQTISTKYSDRNFLEVANIALPVELNL